MLKYTDLHAVLCISVGALCLSESSSEAHAALIFTES